MKIKSEAIKKVPKGWGYELWIANGPLYCGKLLHLEKGKRTSIHYHLIKTETMYLQSGKVRLHLLYVMGPNNNTGGDLSYLVTSGGYSVDLDPGDSFHIVRGLVHRIEALENSDLYEFSTEHFDWDSIRVEKGD